MSERFKAKLGDILDKVIDHRGLTPKKLGSDFTSYGIPVLSAKHIKDGQIINENDFRYVAPEIYDLWMPEKLKKGDILLTSEAPLGEIFFLRENVDYCLGQRLFGLRAKSNILDSRFFYYLIKSPCFQAQLHARATGTTAQGIRQSELIKIEIEFPPLPEQKAIAHILGTLDDKIELNRRMNETLEEMAKAIFKSWFVDFDPVIDNALRVGNPIPDALAEKAARRRAIFEKLEKEDPNLPKLPPEIARLFPDSFEDSPLGPVPRGWSKKMIKEVAQIIKGRSYKSSELSDSDTALVTLKSIARGGGYRPDGLKPFIGSYKQEQVVKPGELVVACTDVTQAGDVIGKPAIVQEDKRFKILVASLDLYIVRSRKEINTPFLYLLFQTEDFQAHIAGHVSGTTVLHLNKNAIPNFKFVCPSSQILDIFDKYTSQIFKKITENEKQSNILSSIRDTLLPKLISGQIRIKDAERFVGEIL